MKIFLIRKNDQFLPLSDFDHEKLTRIKEGQIIEVDYKKPRNPLFHNKFMSMVRLVFANQEQYETIEEVLDVIKVGVGHCNTMAWHDAEIKIPKSISFGKMDELTFADFYDRAVTFALSRFLPTVSKHELEEYVAQIARYAG